MSDAPKRRRADDLPPTPRSMWRLCKLGYQFEPSLMLISFGLVLLAALPDALIALWSKWLADGVQRGEPRLVMAAALALASRPPPRGSCASRLRAFSGGSATK